MYASVIDFDTDNFNDNNKQKVYFFVGRYLSSKWCKDTGSIIRSKCQIVYFSLRACKADRSSIILICIFNKTLQCFELSIGVWIIETEVIKVTE